ncbi:DUF1254 domain-containing protein [Tautonia plasticadhaerens]|uniref:DUF1254 domain-containing protein n=1 Tax=Tautonia plasticadhaerens TaxID=2527974 RepID=A0A518GUQ4_9BACT|nr:DUF1254 domain-containing protein [Tautonia plasticadhaerens]QDV32320.1 hypothetical protein ElP_01480 [Tautonia plasticadhaerens]
MNPFTRSGTRPNASRGRRPARVGLEPLEGRALMTSHAAPVAATDPEAIKALAAEAYVWGLAPEFNLRFSTYNTTIAAPISAFTYGSDPAAWNNAGTNAGDASVLYINGFLDFTRTPAMVLTVPASRDQYYVVNYLDNDLNTIGSIGTRTTPSDEPTSYLLVGPDSPLARFREVDLGGYRYRVMASDTNLNWMLIRVGMNTLADPAAPDSVPNTTTNLVQKFALNSLAEFRRNGHQPVSPDSYSTPTPTPEQEAAAEPYKDTPTEAVRFFEQLGRSVRKSPIPSRLGGLSGLALRRLPPWYVPTVRREAPLPGPLLRPAGRPPVVRADRPDRERLPRPEELGPGATASPAGGVRGGPGGAEPVHRGADGGRGHERLDHPEHDHRHLSE